MTTMNCSNCGSLVNAKAMGCPDCGADPRTGEVPEYVRRIACASGLSSEPNPTPKRLRWWPAAIGLALAAIVLGGAVKQEWERWAGSPCLQSGSFADSAYLLAPFALVLGLRAAIRGFSARRRGAIRRATSSMVLGLATLALLAAALSAPHWAPTGPDDRREYPAALGAHHINLALQAWAADHGWRYPRPEQLDADGLADYLEPYYSMVARHEGGWPVNPFDHEPMHQGTESGDFGYWVSDDGYAFQLVAYGNDEQFVFAAGYFDGQIVLDTM